MISTNNSLAGKMIAIANKDKLADDHEMRVLANKLNEIGFRSIRAKSILGRWARARKCFCEYTGESLI